MKRYFAAFGLASMLLIFCPLSFAGFHVMTNDDNCTASGNTSTTYQLEENTGILKLTKVSKTGGEGNCGGYLTQGGVGLAQDDHCVFVFDGGSSDIASFQIPGMTKVGNYSNPALNGAGGGSVLETANKKFLYATYGGSENIGAWAVSASCALTFIGSYVPSIGPDEYAGIQVTQNGRALLISATNHGAVEMFTINPTSGVLTDKGSIALNKFSDCASAGCFPQAIDITGDSKVAVIGNGSVTEASVFTVNIGSAGLSNAKFWNMTNSANIAGLSFPFLSQAAFSGNGLLYLGGTGYNSGIAGVVAANFTETGPSLSVATTTTIVPAGSGGVNGEIHGLTDNPYTTPLMVVAEWNNTLESFAINSDGTLTPSTQGPLVDPNANGALSFAIYPPLR
jgi:hypothetical protein